MIVSPNEKHCEYIVQS